MIRAHTNDLLLGWPQDINEGISPQDAQLLCVQHAEWQQIRLSMKGISTREKLQICSNWLDGMKKSKLSSGYIRAEELDYEVRLKQVTNYLGALRRGGQLDMNNMIQR